jgi:hypothetical protein
MIESKSQGHCMFRTGKIISGTSSKGGKVTVLLALDYDPENLPQVGDLIVLPDNTEFTMEAICDRWGTVERRSNAI